MYLAAVKLNRTLLWTAFVAGFLALLFPKFVPLELPVVLAASRQLEYVLVAITPMTRRLVSAAEGFFQIGSGNMDEDEPF
jgi:hypothetical protein